ncbi:MAG: inositol phosphorylceramide synthase [Actinomycetia bacterium]|nr:inositol phosphorylceramide synthase [Actinomycetes bacterium]
MATLTGIPYSPDDVTDHRGDAGPGVAAGGRDPTLRLLTMMIRLAIEAAVVLSLYLAYKHVRFLASDQVDQARANANWLISLEQNTGTFVEQSLQRLTLAADGLMPVLNRYYATAHFWLTGLTMLWLFLCHPLAYRRFRRTLVSVTLVALAIHVLWPLAPPRMFAELGFVDTLQVYGPDLYAQRSIGSQANQYAAMPSLHFGYAMLVAGAAISALRTRWRWLAVAHPALTLVAIVVTANHWWLDAAVAGALVVGAAILFDGSWGEKPVLVLGRFPTFQAGQVPALATARRYLSTMASSDSSAGSPKARARASSHRAGHEATTASTAGSG